GVFGHGGERRCFRPGQEDERRGRQHHEGLRFFALVRFLNQTRAMLARWQPGRDHGTRAIRNTHRRDPDRGPDELSRSRRSETRRASCKDAGRPACCAGRRQAEREFHSEGWAVSVALKRPSKKLAPKTPSFVFNSVSRALGFREGNEAAVVAGNEGDGI